MLPTLQPSLITCFGLPRMSPPCHSGGGGGFVASMNLQTMPVELHIPGRASQARQAVTEKPD